MRRAVFVLFAVLIFYMAAMYRSLPFMSLFLLQIFVLVWMLLLTRYLKRHLRMEAPKGMFAGIGNDGFRCEWNYVNTGKLPAGRFRARMRMRYLQETKAHVQCFYGVCESGRGKVCFEMHASYCGMICLRLEQLRVYDYLGMFFGRISLAEEMTVSLLPSGPPLKIEWASPIFQEASFGTEGGGWPVGGGNSLSDEARLPRRDMHYGVPSGYEEIRQIRMYQEGDSYRHIHWNQSARTDRIWIKEYEKEAGRSMTLLLDMDPVHWKNPKDMDAFYRLLHALVLGLIQKADAVSVCWYDKGKGHFDTMEIWNEAQCRDMLLQIYRLDLSKGDGCLEKQLSAYTWADDCLKLDTKLIWSRNEKVIHRFSAEGLEQEIEKQVFVL